jgi:hypothetical protein
MSGAQTAQKESAKLKTSSGIKGLKAESTATPTQHAIQKTCKIQRDVRVRYSRSLYLNKTIFLNVHIAPQGALRPLTPEESKITQETGIEKLDFEASEETPKVKVELKFAEGDFSSGKTKETQKLEKDKQNDFRFMLKALKAEDCVITVVISYMKTTEIIDKVTEKLLISKTTTSQGVTTKEEEEQRKLIPKSTTDEEIELKTIQLRVSVKSLFGMNTRELDLLKKASAPVLYSIFLAVTLLTGQLESNEAIISGFASLLPAFGITAIAEYWKKSETSD